MKCQQCGTKIEKNNKAKFKGGLKLPFCIHCINAYTTAKEEAKKAEALRDKLLPAGAEEIDLSIETIRGLSTEERNTLRYMLRAEGYSEEEITEGFERL